MADTKLETAAAKTEPTFTAEALYSAKKYAGKRDILLAALEMGKEYTMEEADKAVQDFMNHEVKETVNA
jgi:hypothetical protein|nr:MAG TPA: hypothetical protein [Caudoviricetes sp.]